MLPFIIDEDMKYAVLVLEWIGHVISFGDHTSASTGSGRAPAPARLAAGP
jgi:hypothetical protein